MALEPTRPPTEAIDNGRCLAFLGAGASAGYRLADGTEVAGLPTGARLGELLAESCGYTNGSSSDLPRVADYFLFAKSGNRALLHQALRKHLQLPCEPRPIHHVLAQLPQVRVTLTSNYDTRRYERPSRPSCNRKVAIGRCSAERGSNECRG